MSERHSKTYPFSGQSRQMAIQIEAYIFLYELQEHQVGSSLTHNWCSVEIVRDELLARLE